MIERIKEIKSEVLNLETPHCLSEFTDNITLKKICERTELLFKNIYRNDISMQVSKEILERLFYPSENTYTKNIIDYKVKIWAKGKQQLLDILDNRIEDIQQKAEIISVSESFINEEIIYQIRAIENPKFETEKLLQFLKEINDSYKCQNFLSCIFLLRAVLNYTPPIFGFSTFPQVVGQAGRSLKEIFTFLEEGFRKIADLHTHKIISKNEYLPTKDEIFPYKPQFEILLKEILIKLK